MCGRFSITANDAAEIAESLARDLGLKLSSEATTELAALHRPRFNAAPGDRHWLLTRSLHPRMARWGLHTQAHRAVINARAESLWELPSFTKAAKRGRALLLVSGFYEWGGSPRMPWHFRPRSGSLLALAAICQRDASGDPEFAVVTVPAQGALADLHDRMPAMLDARTVPLWLDPSTSSQQGKALLSRASLPLEGKLVDRRVNDPANDDASCLAAPRQGELFA